MPLQARVCVCWGASCMTSGRRVIYHLGCAAGLLEGGALDLVFFPDRCAWVQIQVGWSSSSWCQGHLFGLGVIQDRIIVYTKAGGGSLQREHGAFGRAPSSQSWGEHTRLQRDKIPSCGNAFAWRSLPFFVYLLT